MAGKRKIVESWLEVLARYMGILVKIGVITLRV